MLLLLLPPAMNERKAKEVGNSAPEWVKRGRGTEKVEAELAIGSLIPTDRNFAASSPVVAAPNSSDARPL